MAKIDYESLGYTQALELVFNRRIEARKKYGDKWWNDNIADLDFLIAMKARRVEHSLAKDARIDSLIDLINYSLFALEREISNNGKFKDEIK